MQFIDCFRPTPITEALSDSCWGAETVGPRDQGNGLEDRAMSSWCYWDGAIIKDPSSGEYYLFASRWAQAGGHWGNEHGPGWRGSQAVSSVSDSLFGPYRDLGPLWPDWCGGAGHGVFPFPVSESDPLHCEGWRYAVCISDVINEAKNANGTLHTAKTLQGPWTLLENGLKGRLRCDDSFRLSNVSVALRPGGGYIALNRHGDIVTADLLAGYWSTLVHELWKTIPALAERFGYLEDGVIWYLDGRYHIVVNDWEARQAYYLTSENAVNWVLHEGLAYTPKSDFIRYEGGKVNRWTKIERPNVYIEDGSVKAMTFAVIDVQKEAHLGNDGHGSKIIVVPFDGTKLKAQ
ncbi:MAG: hypothetical protein IKR85_01240 [Clostridia bacterium]|nr:hypothetical protein [Clostridia bacterium]